MFKYIRKRLMPPCSECKWCDNRTSARSWVCMCPEILRHVEKITCMEVDKVWCYDHRGTRHCKFEPKEVGADI